MVGDNNASAWLEREFPRIFLFALHASVLVEHLSDVEGRERLYLGLDASLGVQLLRDGNIFLVLVEEGLEFIAAAAVAVYDASARVALEFVMSIPAAKSGG